MRILLRLILFWLIALPIGLYFGFPYLQAEIEARTQAEAYEQCIGETRGSPEAFDPARPEIAEHYCQCVKEGVVLSRDDMLALIRQEPATGLNERLAQHVEQCHKRLENPAESDAQIIHL